MTDENVRALQTILENLGFPGSTAWDLEAYKNLEAQSFSIYKGKWAEEDWLQYKLHFERGEAGTYSLNGYTLSLTRAQIPDVTVGDIRSVELEVRLRQVDKYYDLFLREDWIEGLSRGEHTRINKFIEQTNGNLEGLAATDEGKEAAKLLMYKYWPEVRYGEHFSDYKQLDSAHKIQQHFPISDLVRTTAEQSYQTLKQIVMNNENFKFLSDNIKYAGFGEDLQSKLERAIKEGKPEFGLQFSTEFSNKPFEAKLNFRKSESSDMYFFNSYHASMERNDGQKVEQTFYLNKGKGITAKEAFNLLDGRHVHKDMVTKSGEPYKAWLQLNPEVTDKNGNMKVEQIHEKYGYDLSAAVSKLAIAELADPKKTDELMASLKKGNVQSVTIEKDGSANKMFIEADPRYKTVKLYDAQMKLMAKDDLSRYQAVGQQAQAKAEKETVSDDKKQEKGRELKPDKQKQEKKNNLLPKKREGSKKGLGVA